MADATHELIDATHEQDEDLTQRTNVRVVVEFDAPMTQRTIDEVVAGLRGLALAGASVDVTLTQRTDPQHKVESGNDAALTNELLSNTSTQDQDPPTPSTPYSPPSSPPSEPQLDELFEEFWKLYPRKVNKQYARAHYYKALKKGFGHADIIAGVKAYPFSDESRFIPHPSTWLNQQRWIGLDEEEAGFSDEDIFGG